MNLIAKLSSLTEIENVRVIVNFINLKFKDMIYWYFLGLNLTNFAVFPLVTGRTLAGKILEFGYAKSIIQTRIFICGTRQSGIISDIKTASRSVM